MIRKLLIHYYFLPVLDISTATSHGLTLSTANPFQGKLLSSCVNIHINVLIFMIFRHFPFTYGLTLQAIQFCSLLEVFLIHTVELRPKSFQQLVLNASTLT